MSYADMCLNSKSKTLGSRASVTSRPTGRVGVSRPACDHRTVNAIRVTAGVTVTACDQRRPICSTRPLRQVTPGRRNDTDPQQPVSF
ncbi:hypothetical protein ElyMa_001468900 [Elysia marginata]|uniref:Uncharacterized protein n=1 Tax=Elysia marginata TaxID=1093978 RepID=A0AAV4J0G7_9GAST|nr:hypothetical protein ElyMa_001468900 [Elysia marginata]